MFLVRTTAVLNWSHFGVNFSKKYFYSNGLTDPLSMEIFEL